jgi:hypothetical protein
MVRSSAWGEIMHWVKWLVEVWILFGVVIVILGLLWTSKLTNKSQPKTIQTASSLPHTELSADHLSKVQSA